MLVQLTAATFMGSLTMPITALAIVQLVEQGKIDLDAPVPRYLPCPETSLS
jgi:CubicO group peptidase (beta-lactamase class C family)